MTNVFINLVIRLGMSASWVRGKKYPKKLNEFTLANNLLLRHILLGTGSFSTLRIALLIPYLVF